MKAGQIERGGYTSKKGYILLFSLWLVSGFHDILSCKNLLTIES